MTAATSAGATPDTVARNVPETPVGDADVASLAAQEMTSFSPDAANDGEPPIALTSDQVRQLAVVALLTAFIVVGLFFIVVKLSGLLDKPAPRVAADVTAPGLSRASAGVVGDPIRALELSVGSTVQSVSLADGRMIMLINRADSGQDVRIYDIASGDLIRAWQMPATE